MGCLYVSRSGRRPVVLVSHDAPHISTEVDMILKVKEGSSGKGAGAG